MVVLSKEDFANYEIKRRSSAMYTLQRRQVKDKLRQLSLEIEAILGADLNGLSTVFSDAAPSLANHHSVDRQWLSWLRSDEASAKLRALQGELKLTDPDALDMAPHHRHAQLAVVVDERFLETSLRIHRRSMVDRENFAARVKDSWARDGMIELLKACGDGYSFGAVNARDLPEQVVAEASADSLNSWLRDGEDRDWICVTATCSIEDVEALGEGLAPACVERLQPLLALYRFVAWAQDNDHIEAKKAIKEAKAEKTRAGFSKGDQVRILAGLWAGRRGTIEDVDKKGGVKVSVGLVSVKVKVDEVATV